LTSLLSFPIIIDTNEMVDRVFIKSTCDSETR